MGRAEGEEGWRREKGRRRTAMKVTYRRVKVRRRVYCLTNTLVPAHYPS